MCAAINCAINTESVNAAQSRYYTDPQISAARSGAESTELFVFLSDGKISNKPKDVFY